MDPCWLCTGLGGVAVHNAASVIYDRTVFVAHKPMSRTHPVWPCPACRLRRLEPQPVQRDAPVIQEAPGG